MAFEITQGLYPGDATRGNVIIDALAAAWEFDSYDNESEQHSVTWGNALIQANSNSSSGGLTIKTVDTGEAVTSTLSLNSGGGSWKIAKTSKSLCLHVSTTSDGIFITLGTATSLMPSGATDKVVHASYHNSIWSTNNPTYAVSAASADSAEYFKSAIWTWYHSEEGTQLMPFIMPTGVVKADNIYLVRMSATPYGSHEVEFDGEKYYINGECAIKDE